MLSWKWLKPYKGIKCWRHLGDWMVFVNHRSGIGCSWLRKTFLFCLFYSEAPRVKGTNRATPWLLCLVHHFGLFIWILFWWPPELLLQPFSHHASSFSFWFLYTDFLRKPRSPGLASEYLCVGMCICSCVCVCDSAYVCVCTHMRALMCLCHAPMLPCKWSWED